MKQIETDFIGRGEVGGVRFTQVFRHKDLCIYKRGDGVWEVIKIRYQKGGIRKFGDKEMFYEEKEYYPKGEDWGKYEWCCNSFESVVKRYNEQAFSMNYHIQLEVDYDKLFKTLTMNSKQAELAAENAKKYEQAKGQESLDELYGKHDMFLDGVELGSVEHFNSLQEEQLEKFNADVETQLTNV
jgi:hypothetical protein